MSEKFTIIISAAIKDERDICIHIRENGKDRLMLKCHFTDYSELDMAFIDDLTKMMAKSIAGNKLECNEKKRGQKKAKRVVDTLIQQMQKR